MTRQKRYYSPEFKREALVMLATGEHTISGLERELGITPGLIKQWKRKEERNGEYVVIGSEPTPPAVAAARIRQLEKETARLRQEREIPKHIVGYRYNRLAQTPDFKMGAMYIPCF